jgi:flagellar biosynthesis protein
MTRTTFPPAEPPPSGSVGGGAADRRAVALHYDPASMAAPTVVALGRGELADRIIALAHQHAVPIKEDRDLVAVLAALDVDSLVPPELYQAIAEVLAFVYRLNGPASR